MSSSLSLVFSAPSGTGKSTIIKALMERTDEFGFAISTTTRGRREGEVDGREYYFVDQGHFETMKDEGAFVEWAKVHDNYYGTSQKEIDRICSMGKIPVFDVDVQGAHSLRHALTSGVFIFILPPSLSVLEERLRNRNTDSENQINIRLNQALYEIHEASIFDYLVINDRLENAVNDVFSIVRAEKLKYMRMGEKFKHIIGSTCT